MEKDKLGLASISAIVFGSMIGGGIFNIAQNLAVGANVGAVGIAWIITALGMLCLVLTFKQLNDARPDLNAGIYQYAQEGFGNYVGFNIAWGYWICTACGNVAYAVILNDSLGVFFPRLLDHGWPTVVLDSALVWTMYFIVIRGIRSASRLNSAITLMKLTCLTLILVALVVMFKADLFRMEIWSTAEVGTVSAQVKNTMMVTLWCFVGIEGAVVMAARARRRSDVGKAGVIGFLLAWVLYAVISVLCYGVMTRAEMASLENPSLAYVLREIIGAWAYYFVVVAVIIALFGGWVAWTMLCAQVPLEAATVKIMPQRFTRLNRFGMPAYGLLMSTIMMQILILVVVMAEHVYMAAILITSMMVLPAYLFSGLYLLKASLAQSEGFRSHTFRYRLTGALCTAYCIWLLYAGGLGLLASTSVCYLAGTWFYVKARNENAPGLPVFSSAEKVVLAVLVAMGAATAADMLFGGIIPAF